MVTHEMKVMTDNSWRRPIIAKSLWSIWPSDNETIVLYIDKYRLLIEEKSNKW